MLDREVYRLRGGDATPFEAIRGVDGVLLPVLDKVGSDAANAFIPARNRLPRW